MPLPSKWTRLQICVALFETVWLNQAIEKYCILDYVITFMLTAIVFKKLFLLIAEMFENTFKSILLLTRFALD